MRASIANILATASLALAATSTVEEPTLQEIEAAAATTLPLSPVSNVKGVAFNKFYQIWLENIDYSAAAGDPNQQWLAKQGITLTNYWAVTHPSEPNYCASAGGDTFGMDNDNFNQVPANISSIADLFDTKKIAWGEYQEHMPYPGFQGFNYSNQVTMAGDYVRKHNPLILYDSVTQDNNRLRQIKNFTNFYEDLEHEKLPQYAFITSNLTNDAHDTTITFGSKWERGFVQPLLENEYFMKDTLLLLTFDETHLYPTGNRVFSILLGGAIPEELKGTEDNTFYTHYSTIASLSANWGLPSLGRWDCGANIFEIVANKTGYVNYEVDTTNLYLNQTLPGPFSTNTYSTYTPDWPVPATSGQCSAGHGILEQVKKTWGHLEPTYNYTSPFPYDTKTGYNVDVTATRKVGSSSCLRLNSK
ncbi:phosphoesterase family-domain-containing protein [Paecilomyces variotii]|uniref:acid phosphatase n=1 Tax=Byssochlamys spectabilis TaxID=264951 RepID=A0A443I3D7_BYSSP|nr:phosphoesterase family-domain-containing protein [Paecilomyces variotii]RWQ98521.1 phosphoesterase family-domain-containing protein [Paecilomyces variotii]